MRPARRTSLGRCCLIPFEPAIRSHSSHNVCCTLRAATGARHGCVRAWLCDEQPTSGRVDACGEVCAREWAVQPAGYRAGTMRFLPPSRWASRREARTMASFPVERACRGKLRRQNLMITLALRRPSAAPWGPPCTPHAPTERRWTARMCDVYFNHPM